MSLRGPRIQLIDCDYYLPKFAGAYLMHVDGEAAFVESNTAHAVPWMLETLKNAGGRPEDIRYLVITHAHLDHSGGASALMKVCPRATLLTHPRAARHLIDPARLIAGAKKVYGEKHFAALYGEIEPIPAERVKAMEDGEEAPFGRGTFRFLHTRGHANHHAVVQYADAIFTGDAFGLMYPPLQSQGMFVFPSTSPTDFDGSAARESLTRIARSGAQAAWLTHFGRVGDLELARQQLDADLEFAENLLTEAIQSSLPDAELDAFCEQKWIARMKSRFQKQGLPESPELWRYVEMDLKLNGAGIAHVARTRRSGASTVR